MRFGWSLIVSKSGEDTIMDDHKIIADSVCSLTFEKNIPGFFDPYTFSENNSLDFQQVYL